MRRKLYLWSGIAAVGLGVIGIALPVVPTVPFLILAAWCFGRSNPVWEARLLAHPRFGPHIRAWRERGAVSRLGKWGATMAFAGSIALAAFLTQWPWPLVPAGIAAITLAWLWTRPDA